MASLPLPLLQTVTSSHRLRSETHGTMVSQAPVLQRSTVARGDQVNKQTASEITVLGCALAFLERTHLPHSVRVSARRSAAVGAVLTSVKNKYS